jgi:hypothetical protein
LASNEFRVVLHGPTHHKRGNGLTVAGFQELLLSFPASAFLGFYGEIGAREGNPVGPDQMWIPFPRRYACIRSEATARRE